MGDNMQKCSGRWDGSVLFFKMTEAVHCLSLILLFALLLLTTDCVAAKSFSKKKNRIARQANYQPPKYQPLSKKVKKKKVKTLQKGTSSSAARRAALAALPMKKLTKAQQKRVKHIVGNIGMFRKLPTLQFQIEPEAYQFFVKHPDVACSIWRVMKISQLEMYQTGPWRYDIDMKDGTVGVIDILQQSNTSQLIICEGEFKSPFITKPMKAEALLHLQAKQIKDRQGKDITVHQASLFVSFPSQTVEAAAKFISPISNIMIDQNFHEMSLFAQMMSFAMKRQPGWVEQTANKMEGVLKIRKPQLIKLTAKVYLDYRKEQLTKSGKKHISIEDIMQPLRQISAETQK